MSSEGNHCNNETESAEETTLSPPRSCGEKLRDGILRTLDHPFFQILGIIVIVLIVADGAFFFFLLLGWQGMCRPRMDCEPRNWWYNFSIQVLNVLFTYTAIVSMPWRSTHFLHILGWGCPKRKNTLGHDLYGLPVDSDPWFYIPLRRRLGITIILLLNCLTQFANQATRVKYYSFELQNEFPGNMWTNIFFAASFFCAGVAGVWMGYEVYVLRRGHPKKFGPDAISEAMAFYDEKFSKKGTQRENSDETNNRIVEQGHQDHDFASEQELRDVVPSPLSDPTRERHRRSVVKVERSSMRMWAM